jgi:N-acylglucosamine 2-epimerase
MATIKHWKEVYLEQINDYFLPFWNEQFLDKENGGYFTCVDREGNVYSTDKSVWFQGRAGYIFALIYNTYKQDEQYLNISKSCVEFMDKHCFDTDGRMYFTVTKEGKPLRKRRYYYSETFYIVAAAELYKATKEEKYLLNARKVFDLAYSIYLDGNNDPFKITPKSDANTRCYKTLGPSMILLNVVNILKSADVEKVEYYNEISIKLIEEIKNNFYHPELEMVLENVNLDGSVDFEFPEGRHQNPGHAIEAAWFILNEYGINKNEEYVKMALNIIDYSLKAGWDTENEGLRYFTDALNKPVVQLECDLKLWWPHNEAIIATLYAYHITKDQKYYDWFEKLSKYTLGHFPDPNKKEWYGYLTKKNEVNNEYKGSFFKGPFHIPRMMLKVIELLNEIGE